MIAGCDLSLLQPSLIQNHRAEAPAEHPADFRADGAAAGEVDHDARADRQALFAFGHEAAVGDVPQLGFELPPAIVGDGDVGLDRVTRRALDVVGFANAWLAMIVTLRSRV